MKINFYLTLIVLLFFSIGQAQSDKHPLEEQQSKTPLVANEKEIINVSESQTLVVDTLELQETIARIESDISLYFKRQKKVSNISLVFPKMNLEALS